MLRRLFRLLVVLSVVAILAVLAVWTMTNTDYGREKVRQFALEKIRGGTHGIVNIGALHGDLLSGATFTRISITDSAGRPFLRTDSLSARYGLRDLITRRIHLRDVVLYNPDIVVEKLPRGEWNYRRLWPQLGHKAAPGDTVPGWGSWVRFDNLRVFNGNVKLLSPWEPKAGLTARVRDSLIRDALRGGSRLRIVRAPGGFQKIVSLDSIDAILPQLRIADPRYRNRFAAVSALRMVAYPFQPPGARVTALTGNFDFNDDSLWWRGIKAQLPGSKLGSDGSYAINSGDMKLKLAASPAALGDFRWVMPTFPRTGGGRLRLAITWKGATQDYVIRDADVRTEGAHLQGNLGFTLTDTIFFHDADVKFAGLTFKLINQVFPGTGTPRPGELAGTAKFSGTLKRLKVDRSDVTYLAYGRGTTRFLASGVVGFSGKPVVVMANNLRVRLAPLQMDLVKLILPTMPVGGTLTGTATLNGRGDRQLVASALDIVHQDGPNRSHVVGVAGVHTTGRQTLDVDVVAKPLALAELNRFAPALGLKGLASGPIHAHGPLDAMRMDTRLAVPGDATFALRGTVDFLSKELGYDVALGASRLNLSRVMAGGPVTSLTGSGTARGRGFKPATMYADLAFDFGPSSVDTIGLDSAVIRARVANGLATIARAQARGAGATLDIAGRFGMDARHSGSLTYALAVDSVGTLSRFLPSTFADTGAVPPRPLLASERLARARADSAALARATEVARVLSGRPAERLQVDTPRAIPRGLLAGSLRANGTISGSIARFNLNGTASGTGLVVRGNAARHLTSTYSWTDARTAHSKLAVSLSADTVSAFGFAFDSLSGDLSYLKPNGSIAIKVRQSGERDYALSGDFTLHPQHNELHLRDAALRFDTATWTMQQPSTIRWGARGIEVMNLELRNGPTRRIYANGLLPTEGRANFDLAISGFAVENIAALLQSDLPATGIVNLDAHVEGTSAAPIMRGRVDLEDGTYNGTVLPAIHGTFDYANQRLTTNATAIDSTGLRLATVNGTIPINLALSGVTGSRLIDAPIDVAVVSDSLPLTLIPNFTDAVTDLGGKVSVRATVGGTLKKPVLQGGVTVADAQFKLGATGAFLKNVNGGLRMVGDTVYVDSIAGRATGPVRVSGTIAVGNRARPAFNLTLHAEDAELLHNERGELHANAGLRMTGPFDSVYVSGQVTVLHGVLYLPPSTGKQLVGAGDPALFSVIDTSVAAQREIFPAQSPMFRNLRMDVDLAVQRDSWVRSREANVEVYTEEPMRVSVSGDALALTGAINADHGEYTFLSKRFQITRGSALFIGTPELNPTIQVTAENVIHQPTGNVNIRVLVGGTLEKPRISLESDAQPPLTQSEMLSYLAFGETSGSLLQATGVGSLGATQGGNVVAAAGSRLAALALGEMLDQLEGDAAKSLGADQFNITPGAFPLFTGGDAGQFLRGTELEAGWYLNPRTFASVVVTPGFITCVGGTRNDPNSPCSTPGITLVHRTSKGYRFETAFVPHYFLNTPTLAGQTAYPSAQFGAFAIREWRF